MIVVNSSKRLTRLQLAYSEWLKTLGNPTHAVTITFKRYLKDTNQLWNISIIKKSTKIFLNLLNKFVFGKNAKKYNQCIMTVVVIGTGSYEDHPHAHFALQRPKHLSWDDFTALVVKAINLTRWMNSELNVEPYHSEGWLEYMLEHGEQDLLVDLCTPARP